MKLLRGLVVFRYFLSSLKPHPKIIAVGDSWFSLLLFNWYKIRRVDALDWLKKYEFNIIDCAAPGYQLKTESYFKLYRCPLKLVVKKQKKVLVLLSLGGNDFAWKYLKKAVEVDGKKSRLNKNEMMKYVNTFFIDMKKYIATFENDFYDDGGKEIKFVIHGYDYVDSSKDYFGFGGDGSLSDMFKEWGITDHKVVDRIVHGFIDIFNNGLAMLANDMENVYHVDLRGTLERDDWFEDVHPTPRGYAKVAKVIDDYVVKNIPEEYYR